MFKYLTQFLLIFWGGILVAQSSYHQRLYTLADGLPTNSVRATFQVEESYLWILTNSGMLRYDGTNFDPYTAFEGKNPLSNDYVGHTSSSNQAIVWSNQDVLLFENQRFKVIKSFKKDGKFGLPQSAFFLLDDVGVLTEKGILMYADSEQHEQFIQGAFWAATSDLMGNIWALDEKGIVWYFSQKKKTLRRVYTNIANQTIQNLQFDSSNIILSSEEGDWVYDRFGKWTFKTELKVEKKWKIENGILKKRDKSGDYQTISTSYDLSQNSDYPAQLSITMDGSVWISMEGLGLLHISEKPIQTLNLPLVASTNSIVFDKEEQAWVAYYENGVYGKANSINTASGLPTNDLYGLSVNQQNEIWIATTGGLYKKSDNRIESIGKSTGLPDDIFIARVLYEDMSGQFYVGADRLDKDAPHYGVYSLENGRFQFVTQTSPKATITALIKDNAGTLWIGTYNQGLFAFRDGVLKKITETEKQGIGGLYVDKQNRLWYGTEENGLGMIQNGKVRQFDTLDGFLMQSVWTILEDNQGRMWLSGELGIGVVNKNELLKSEKSSHISTFIFKNNYGTDNSCNGFQQPTGSMDAGGKLYFPCGSSINYINPDDIQIPKIKPIISNLQTESRNYLYAPNINLHSEERNLTFSFNTLNFNNSKNTPLFYCLERESPCKKEDWQGNPAIQTATFNDLAPGSYTFRVRGGMNMASGKIPEVTLKLNIPPKFYETLWFKVFVFFLFIGLVYAIYKYRLNQRYAKELELVRNALLNEFEIERKTMSANIHDGPLQDLSHLTTQLQKVQMQQEEQSEVLTKLVKNAQNLGTELRNISADLMPSELTDLGLDSAMRRYIKKYKERYPNLKIQTDLAEEDCKLPENKRLTLYRIFQEAFNNIGKHAEASEVHVRFEMQSKMAVLVIKDNGKGFTPPKNLITLREEDHLGLVGMQARCQSIDAIFELESEPLMGTKIQIKLTV